jgi:hypothetical protein
MKPGAEVEHDRQTWTIEKMEIRGSVAWVLINRLRGEERRGPSRRWVEQSVLLAARKERP